MVVVGFVTNTEIKWLRCVNCGGPHARAMVNGDDLRMFPSLPPLSSPDGLPAEELSVWMEVRECLAVGAYTAAVMLCRKMLFHLAVANGLAAKSDKGRAPTFVEAVDHLQAEGIITARMRPWVDRIKDIGNEATHDLSAIPADKALDVARFTEQLLRLAFEMDAIMALASETDPDRPA